MTASLTDYNNRTNPVTPTETAPVPTKPSPIEAATVQVTEAINTSIKSQNIADKSFTVNGAGQTGVTVNIQNGMLKSVTLPDGTAADKSLAPKQYLALLETIKANLSANPITPDPNPRPATTSVANPVPTTDVSPFELTRRLKVENLKDAKNDDKVGALLKRRAVEFSDIRSLAPEKLTALKNEVLEAYGANNPSSPTYGTKIALFQNPETGTVSAFVLDKKGQLVRDKDGNLDSNCQILIGSVEIRPVAQATPASVTQNPSTQNPVTTPNSTPVAPSTSNPSTTPGTITTPATTPATIMVAGKPLNMDLSDPLAAIRLRNQKLSIEGNNQQTGPDNKRSFPFRKPTTDPTKIG